MSIITVLKGIMRLGRARVNICEYDVKNIIQKKKKGKIKTISDLYST